MTLWVGRSISLVILVAIIVWQCILSTSDAAVWILIWNGFNIVGAMVSVAIWFSMSNNSEN